jgi:hypothetical protein
MTDHSPILVKDIRSAEAALKSFALEQGIPLTVATAIVKNANGDFDKAARAVVKMRGE